jgi:hypothetical protein
MKGMVLPFWKILPASATKLKRSLSIMLRFETILNQCAATKQ